MAARSTTRSIGSKDGILLVAMVIALVLLLFGSALYVFLSGGQSASPTQPIPGPIVATLNLSSKTVGVVPHSFWGLNVRADLAPTPAMLSFVTSTPVNTFRWPGGNLAERYNMTSNGGAGLIYNDDGSTSTPGWTTAEFVTWCESINCQAIITVPAEIDNPAVAASFVEYVEITLGFHPAYWEIGNEPDLWTHFGVPWNHWTTLQQIGATPSEFAGVVHSYIAAMKGVDPDIRFIGLGGVGGAGGEAAWLSAVVGENGPNLTAIALHYYPAGSGSPGESDTTIYSTVNGANSLPVRFARDSTQIRSACPVCNIRIIVDEFSAGSGNNMSAFMSGFLLVPFITAELEQGIYLNLSTMSLWVLENTNSGAMFDTSGNAHPVSLLYSEILSQLAPDVLHLTVSTTLPDLFALATENHSISPITTLLIANLNTTYPASIQLAGSGFPTSSPGTVLLWTPSTSVPQSLSLSSSSEWILPPESIGLWIADADVSAASHAPHAGTPPSLGAMQDQSAMYGTAVNCCQLAVPMRTEVSS